MSQVHIETETNSIPECVHRLGGEGSVLVVGQPVETREFRRVAFPLETHWEQAEETVYTEHVTRYEVLRVIHSPQFTVGDVVWIWREPYYDLESMRAYHEMGLSESPIVMETEPLHPIEGDQRIAFIRPLALSSEAFPALHMIDAEEGLAAEPEISALLGRRATLTDVAMPFVDDDGGILEED